MSTIYEALAAPFPPEAISWRVGSTTKQKDKGMALAYIDARDAQDRLNQVCGPFGWQCRHEVSSDKRVTCHVGIRNELTGEWVWKSDGAGETDYEGEKGSYSDSFKRACVKWGIGRYLYDLDSPWVAIEARGSTYIIPPAEQRKLTGRLKTWQFNYFHGGGPRHSPTSGVDDALSDDEKEEIERYAANIEEYMETGDKVGAYECWARVNLGTEGKTAVWKRLNSTTRTALKAQKATKEAA